MYRAGKTFQATISSNDASNTNGACFYKHKAERKKWRFVNSIDGPNSEDSSRPEHYLRERNFLCGRGRQNFRSAGNIMYHTLVTHVIPDYAAAKVGIDKTNNSIAIVDAVKNAARPGRFIINTVIAGGRRCLM